MNLPLQITFHGVDRSDSTVQYIRKRAEKLRTFDPRLTGCRVAVEMPHRRSRHGGRYRVRVDLSVPGAELLARRVPTDDRAYEDLYAAVDSAFDVIGRRLQDFVRRRREA